MDSESIVLTTSAQSVAGAVKLSLLYINFLPIFLGSYSYNNTYKTYSLVFNGYRFNSTVVETSTEKVRRRKGPKTPSAPELSQFQKEAIFGLMLGDLSAERYSLKGNTRLRFFMSIKNKDYIMHLYSMFSEYVLTPPKEMVRKKINKLTGKLQTDIAFSTLKYSIFNWTMEDFYVKVENKNIKFVPAKANENLTAVSLAY